MRKLLTLFAIALVVVVSSCSKFDDTPIWDKLNDHENRITALEELCKQMNTNIEALQTIVEALEKRIKEKYKNKIQVYLGIEEDLYSTVNRADFEYMIGSSHYFCVDSKYYPIDSNYDVFKKCLEIFEYDVIRLAKTYYEV